MDGFNDKLFTFENSITYNTRMGYLREGDQVISLDRDYTETIIPQFSLVYPQVLDDRISKEDFARVVTAVNGFLREAEAIKCSACCECLAGYFTCFLSNILCTNHYERCLIRLTKYLNEQNNYFVDYGIIWLNPVSNGLLHLDILLKARKSGLLKVKDEKENITVVTGSETATAGKKGHNNSGSGSSGSDNESTPLHNQAPGGLQMK